MQIAVNFQNETIAQKVLWMLEHFQNDGVEVIKLDNTDDDIKKAEQLAKSGKYKPMSSEKAKKLDRLVTLSTMSSDLVSRMEKANWDADISESVWNKLGKVFKTGTIADASKAKEIIKQQQFSTEVKSMLADYINLVSGQGVTDAERKNILETFNIGDFSDKDAIIRGMKTFSNIMQDRGKLGAKGIKSPLDLINYSRDFSNIKKFKYDASTKDASTNSNDKPTKTERKPLSSFAGGN